MVKFNLVNKSLLPFSSVGCRQTVCGCVCCQSLPVLWYPFTSCGETSVQSACGRESCKSEKSRGFLSSSNRPHSNSDYNNEAVREKTFGCWSWKSFDPQKKRKQERKCVHLYFCDCIGSYRNRSLLRGNTARAQLIYGLHEIRAQCNEPKVIFFTPGVERW